MKLDDLIRETKNRLFGSEENGAKPQKSKSESRLPIFDTTDLSTLFTSITTGSKKEKGKAKSESNGSDTMVAPKKKKEKAKPTAIEVSEVTELSSDENGVHICIDLGNDTVKIAYAYSDNGKLRYGKILKDGLINTTALSSTAYYDASENRWIYADEIEQGEEKSFTTVVKIKNLLSLLGDEGGETIVASNRDYYENGNDFPKFYFPVKRTADTDFASMVSRDMTFKAGSYTPKKVCEGFFEYIKSVAKEKLTAIADKRKIQTDGDELIASVSLVHPPTYSEAQTEELARLITLAFGKYPKKIMTTTRALCLYAYQRGALKVGDSALAFDMGDETLSVVKGRIRSKNGKIAVIADGIEGHNEPIAIGGGDIDTSVGEFLESAVAERETMGSAKAGEDGHIYESGLDSKQYLFMKEIKKAKMILSKQQGGGGLFADGVPVSLYRDVHIQRKLTKAQFNSCVGISTDNKIAKGIADYIITEIGMPVNSSVKKVFLAGGLVETYGLVDYLREKINEKFPKVEVLTFDDENEKKSGDEIKPYEDSIYASAVGGAIVALNDYDVKTGISLSYGTWGGVPSGVGNEMRRCLLNFVFAGTEIEYDGQEFYSQFPFKVENSMEVNDEEIFSSTITEEAMENMERPNRAQVKYFSLRTVNCLEVGLIGSPERKRAKKAFNLTTEAGGGGSKIYIYHDGKRIKVGNNKVWFVEGVKVDKKGKVHPIIENAVERNGDGKVSVTYLSSNITKKVYAKDITFKFVGVKDFTATIK